MLLRNRMRTPLERLLNRKLRSRLVSAKEKEAIRQVLADRQKFSRLSAGVESLAKKSKTDALMQAVPKGERWFKIVLAWLAANWPQILSLLLTL